MTPEQARLRAVEALADELDRAHDDPRRDAEQWVTRLMRSGWRYVPALTDQPGPPRAAPRSVAEQHLAEIRAELAAVRRRRGEGGVA